MTDLATLGRAMREAQRLYFKTRTPDALAASKRAEKAFDEALAAAGDLLAGGEREREIELKRAIHTTRGRLMAKSAMLRCAIDDRDRLAAEVAMLREALRDLLDVCIAADPEQSVFPQQMQNAHFALDGLPPPSVMEANTRLEAEVERLRGALSEIALMGCDAPRGMDRDRFRASRFMDCVGIASLAIGHRAAPAPTPVAPERDERDERAIRAAALREAAKAAADHEDARLTRGTDNAGVAGYCDACRDIADALNARAAEIEGEPK